jgi:hypothetical protein
VSASSDPDNWVFSLSIRFCAATAVSTWAGIGNGTSPNSAVAGGEGGAYDLAIAKPIHFKMGNQPLQ